MVVRLNVLSFGAAAAAVVGTAMLLFSLVALTGRAADAEALMESMHIFYQLTPLGTVMGVLEGAAFGFAVGAPFAWLYNMVSNAARPD